MPVGNCQGVVGAELAVSGTAMGATLLVFNGSFNGAGRCFVRGAVLVPPPLPNDTFVAVTEVLVLGRGPGSKTPFLRAARPGSLPGTFALVAFSLGGPPPGFPSGAARRCPPCKVGCACLLVVTWLKPRPRILMAWARDSLENGSNQSSRKCVISRVSKRLYESRSVEE